MTNIVWPKCLQALELELSEQHLNTWIRPLQVVENESKIELFAPNRFVLDRVKKDYFPRILEVVALHSTTAESKQLLINIGTSVVSTPSTPTLSSTISPVISVSPAAASQVFSSNLNSTSTFDSFVEGKSNQLAKAAAMQVADSSGTAYNPLLIYGGVGLGKTHLMHAVGNQILQQNPTAHVVYLHSERFVQDMVKALQHNAIDNFKRHYRSVDALLIDDIQFFAGKERSQEEFFHTFNALLEDQRQIIITCDRYPKEVEGLEERLKSRFGWGLTQSIEPPELEDRKSVV